MAPIYLPFPPSFSLSLSIPRLLSLLPRLPPLRQQEAVNALRGALVAYTTLTSASRETASLLVLLIHLLWFLQP